MKTHLDLFSGIGGFALAAQWNGLETIGFSEIEPYACKVLAQHWPGVPNLGDIRAMAGVRCDLITGGFPCQPFSCAGKRRGKEDDRHLWPEMLRVIAESRPAWVLCENVPGIIKMELDSVLSDLEAIGYACWPCVIPACAVDAKHQRKRLWIVAYSQHERLEERKEQPAWQECQTTKRGCPAVPNANGQPTVGPAIAWSEHCQWLPEPGLGRVASGVPNRAHRIKAIGNSIVPQVAENLLHWIRRAA